MIRVKYSQEHLDSVWTGDENADRQTREELSKRRGTVIGSPINPDGSPDFSPRRSLVLWDDSDKPVMVAHGNMEIL